MPLKTAKVLGLPQRIPIALEELEGVITAENYTVLRTSNTVWELHGQNTSCIYIRVCDPSIEDACRLAVTIKKRNLFFAIDVDGGFLIRWDDGCHIHPIDNQLPVEKDVIVLKTIMSLIEHAVVASEKQNARVA